MISRRVSVLFQTTGAFLCLLFLFKKGVSADSRDRKSACREGGPDLTNVCDCNRSPQGADVRCVSRGLAHIPVDVLTNTTQLAIIQNTISRIEEKDFEGQELLRILHLEKNGIIYIHPKAFRNMYHLETLNLQENSLIQLDPSGMMFQHLPAMTDLNLQTCKIQSLNKYSFLTLRVPEKEAIVQLNNNAVQCDCQVKALRDWISTPIASSDNREIEFQSLNCQNYPQNSLFTSVPDSFFSKCKATDGPLDSTFECPLCKDVSTNYACQLSGTEQCGSGKVCKKSIVWNQKESKMLISSGCADSTMCLTEERHNTHHCGLQNENITCTFCCVDYTCEQDSIGGRTKDFSYYMEYISFTGPFQPYMNDPSSDKYSIERDRITKILVKEFKHLKGGVTSAFQRFEPVNTACHKVVLKLDITAFSIETSNSVQSTLKSDLFMGNNRVDDSGLIDLEKVDPSSIIITDLLNGYLQCDWEVRRSDKGTFIWPPIMAGMIMRIICPYQNQSSSGISVAMRKCTVNDTGNADWEDPDDSMCPFHPTRFEEIENMLPVKEDNVEKLSELLKASILNIGEKINAKMVSKVVDILEMITLGGKVLMKQPSVSENCVQVIDSILDVEEDVLTEAEVKDECSQRLLAIIDSVAEEAPLENGHLKIVSPNIAIAAQGLNRGENGFVKLSSSPRVLSDNQVNVALTPVDSAHSEENNIVIIPASALLDSIPLNQRMAVDRVAFSVLESDKLFKTMQPVVRRSQVPEGAKFERAPFRTQIASQVLSVSVPGVKTSLNLTKNVTMTFQHEDVNSTNPRCVFWDVAMHNQNQAGGWSEEGCSLKNNESGYSTCTCSHLTNFALLMDIYQEGTSLSEVNKKVLSIISYIGCGVSLAGLFLTLLTYGLFKRLRRDNPSKILLNLCLALFVSNLIFVVGMHDYAFTNRTSCKLVAVLLHYFLMASITWMAVEAFYMYLALIKVLNIYFEHFLLKCALVGWGVPLVIVVITLAINETDNYDLIDSSICWITTPAFYGVFVAPVCLILLLNSIAFVMVIWTLRSLSNAQLGSNDRRSLKQQLKGCIGVVILLGLCWLFAVFAVDQASVIFYYLFAIFNSLQGLFIFIYYVILKRDALSAWRQSLPCSKASKQQPSCVSPNTAASSSETRSSDKSVHQKFGNTTFSSLSTSEGDLTAYIPQAVNKNSAYSGAPENSAGISSKMHANTKPAQASPILLPSAQETGINQIASQRNEKSQNWPQPAAPVSNSTRDHGQGAQNWSNTVNKDAVDNSSWVKVSAVRARFENIST